MERPEYGDKVVIITEDKSEICYDEKTGIAYVTACYTSKLIDYSQNKGLDTITHLCYNNNVKGE